MGGRELRKGSGTIIMPLGPRQLLQPPISLFLRVTGLPPYTEPFVVSALATLISVLVGCFMLFAPLRMPLCPCFHLVTAYSACNAQLIGTSFRSPPGLAEGPSVLQAASAWVSLSLGADCTRCSCAPPAD